LEINIDEVGGHEKDRAYARNREYFVTQFFLGNCSSVVEGCEENSGYA
jgi:hypothetical protein